MTFASSLIIARLTDREYDKFIEARIPYSGATGKGAKDGYGDKGPYIATFTGELRGVLDLLEWDNVLLEVHGSDWTIRRAKKRKAVDRKRKGTER